MKEIIGVIAVILTFVGYIPYIRDTIRGKTQPHIYSWLLWGFITAIAFGVQVSGHAGPGSLVTIAAALVCFVIMAFGLRRGQKDITKSDTIFFILGLIATSIWLIAKQPVLSVLLLSAVDMLGFVPTIRKSWHKPHSETLLTYQLNTFRFALALLALDRYTMVTALYPATWVLANGLFSVLLVVRRKALPQVDSFAS